jgi:hypothetical protein
MRLTASWCRSARPATAGAASPAFGSTVPARKSAATSTATRRPQAAATQTAAPRGRVAETQTARPRPATAQTQTLADEKVCAGPRPGRSPTLPHAQALTAESATAAYEAEPRAAAATKAARAPEFVAVAPQEQLTRLPEQMARVLDEVTQQLALVSKVLRTRRALAASLTLRGWPVSRPSACLRSG